MIVNEREEDRAREKGNGERERQKERVKGGTKERAGGKVTEEG